jgi:hypothetical protein
MSNPKKVNTLVSLKDEVKEKLREDIIMLKLEPGIHRMRNDADAGMADVRSIYSYWC